MATNTPKKVSTPFEKMITLIVTLVILAVLALAVYATYGKISANMAEKAIAAENAAIQSGQQEANVRYMAENSGKSVEEYLSQYGLTLGEDLTESTTVSDMSEKMTVENYYKYLDENSGQEEQEPTNIEELLNAWSAADYGITKDTTWKEVTEKLPFVKYVGSEENFNSILGQYSSGGYDVSAVTTDMTIKEVNDKLSEIAAAGPSFTPVPSDAAAE